MVPEGCANLAFIGQFVETDDDAVFTVETSCRTGMYAAYALSGIEKKPLEVAPTFYDVRYIQALLKKVQGIEGEVTQADRPRVNPLKLREAEAQLLELANRVGRARA